jgi:hypothetical protein
MADILKDLLTDYARLRVAIKWDWPDGESNPDASLTYRLTHDYRIVIPPGDKTWSRAEWLRDDHLKAGTKATWRCLRCGKELQAPPLECHGVLPKLSQAAYAEVCPVRQHEWGCAVAREVALLRRRYNRRSTKTS